MPATVTGASLSIGSSAGRWPYRQMPGRVAGLTASSQAATADEGGGACCGTGGGAPGGAGGRGGIEGTSGGPAGRGTGFACVPRASRIPSLSIARAP
ncbi:hypothetical protein ACFFKE_16695 [Streptomyces mutabilis]|uniref:hypothetical protein n=1 Tax=Streptomyces mutabilis TaxID=67332 RepID=UPI0019A59EC3|nr:hypothetical protein [Streptomyces mutabilis]GGQ39309.1 hypothetical protein GCM10010279_55860 [Streptomyces mutabilis]